MEARLKVHVHEKVTWGSADDGRTTGGGVGAIKDGKGERRNVHPGEAKGAVENDYSKNVSMRRKNN